MSLASGARLGPYEIIAPLGAGGMGEVAIKVLPAERLSDEARRSRRGWTGPASRGATLVDLGSRNGTFVDGARLDGPRALRDGDTIRLGRRLSLAFRRLATDPTETEASA